MNLKIYVLGWNTSHVQPIISECRLHTLVASRIYIIIIGLQKLRGQQVLFYK